MAEVRIVAIRTSAPETEEEKGARLQREQFPYGSPVARREANRLRIPSSQVEQEPPYYGDEDPPDH